MLIEDVRMDQEVEIVTIDSPDEAILGAVESLFTDLYEHMTEGGLKLPLAPDGAHRWRQSLSAGLGRFGTLVIARVKSDGTVVGFVQGMLRKVPDYLQGNWTGFIPHVFVLRDHRGRGYGLEMVNVAMEWFRQQNVESVELQVLITNESATRFWRTQGFETELIQMRRPLT